MATAKKKSTKKSTKKLNIKIKMIGDLIDVTGSSKDSWNPAEISDDMKAISYIRKLADSWNTAQLNEALKYLGFKTVDTWNAAELEETKNKLVKYFLPTEATGNPITFNTYGNLPYEVSKAEVTFLPKQSGSGEPSPDNVRPISGWTEVNLNRTGKNLLENTATTNTLNGVTFTVNSDGTVVANGTASGNANFYLNGNSVKMFGQSIITGCPTGGSSNTYFVEFYDTENSVYSCRDYGNGNNIQAEANGDISRVVISVRSGYTANNLIFKPMIRLATETDATFEPYVGQNYTEPLGATYYGGKVDFVSGEGQNDYQNIDENSFSSVAASTSSGGLHWADVVIGYTPTNIVCDRLTRKDGNSGWSSTTPCISYVESGGSKLLRIYCSESTISDFKTAYAGLQIVFSRETPATLTLTPQEIELLKGQNVISTDGDSITIKYKALLN